MDLQDKMESRGHNRNDSAFTQQNKATGGLQLDQDMIDESFRASSADNVLYFHDQFDQSTK